MCDDFELYRARSYSGGFDVPLTPRRGSLASYSDGPSSTRYLGDELYPRVTEMRRRSDTAPLGSCHQMGGHQLSTSLCVDRGGDWVMTSHARARSLSVSPGRPSRRATDVFDSSVAMGREAIVHVPSSPKPTRHTRSPKPSRRKSTNAALVHREDEQWCLSRPRLQSMPSTWGTSRSPGRRHARLTSDLAKLLCTTTDDDDMSGCKRMRSFSITKRGRLIREADQERSRSNSTCSNESRKDESTRSRTSSFTSAIDTPHTPVYKIVVTGSKTVGKKSIIAQFTSPENRREAMQSFGKCAP